VIRSKAGVLPSSIHHAGGSAISTAYEAQSKKASSDAVISIEACGLLACRRVYFLPWKPTSDHVANQKSLQKFVADAVNKAVQDKYQSVAFPAVGCGKHDLSISSVALAMCEEARRQSFATGISIVFVIQAERTDIYDAFQEQINSAAPKGKPVSTKVANATIEVEEGDITKQKVRHRMPL
jgi:hypothetical protein